MMKTTWQGAENSISPENNSSFFVLRINTVLLIGKIDQKLFAVHINNKISLLLSLKISV